MAEQVEIDVIAKDMTSGAMNSVRGSLTELNSAIMIGEKVLGYLTKAYEKTVGAAQTYDQQVYELMLKTGGTADETSRLIQVIDDTGIEYSVLETAMKFAVKNGIDPNIESLAELSDEYIALKNPVEQGQLLMKKFGRSGLEMVRAMDLGGDALRRMAGDMEGGLILTEENVKASEDYRIAIDTLQDAYKGLAISAGNDLIPALVDISNAMIKNIDDYGNFKDANNDLVEFMNYPITTLGKWVLGIADSSNELDTATRGYIAMAKAIEGTVSPTEDETEALAEQSKALEAANKSLMTYNSQTMSIIGSLQTSWEGYRASYETVTNDISLNDDQRKAKLAELSAAYELETNKIILSMTAQVLASDGLTTTEMAYLLDKGKAWGIYSDSVVREGGKAIREIEVLNTQLNNLPVSKQVIITIATKGLEALRNTSLYYSSEKGGYDGKAAGGSVSAGTPYIVGERGQELFVPGQSGTIIPNNKLSGGGSNININIVTPALIGSDGAARDALLPILRAGVRQLQSEGLLPL